MNMFRVVMYVKNLNGYFHKPEDIVNIIKNHKYLPFTTITEVLETDIGEWHDDHELNFLDGDCAKYFPDAEYHPNLSFPLEEYRRVRSLMLTYVKRLRDAESEIRELKNIDFLPYLKYKYFKKIMDSTKFS